jgi:tetratricopeptide (TPR) repeat protein
MLVPRAVLSGVVVAAALCASACSKPAGERAAEHLAKGDSYLAKDQVREAVIEYRSAVQATPQDGEARKKLADAHIKNKDLQGAFAETIRAADLLPDVLDLQIRAAELLLVAQQFEDARTRVDKVLARKPDHAQALMLRGNALAGLKDLDGGMKDVEAAIKLDPSRGESYANLGQFQLAKGRRAEAEAAFKKAVAVAPKSVTTHLALANFYLATNQPQSAHESFKAALAIDPKHLLANQSLATFSVLSGKPEQAEPYLKAVAAVANTPEARLAVGDYYASMRRFDDAVGVFTQVAAEDGQFVTGKARLARVALARGQLPEAMGFANEALEKDPRSSQALHVKGQIHLAGGQREEAVTVLTEAIAQNSREIGAHFTLGLAYYALSNFDEAVRSFQAVLGINPRALAAQFHLGRAQLARFDASAALATLAPLLTVVPGDPETRALVVRAHLLKGDSARAAAELGPLQARFPKAPTTHVLTGALAAARRDLAGARRAYERALAIDPKNLDALSGMAALTAAAGKPTEAIAMADKAAADNPTAPAQIMAARAHLAGGDAAGAEKALRRAIEIDPSYLPAYGMLGGLYAGQKRLAAARTEFESILIRQPKSVGALTLIGMLWEAEGQRTQAEQAYRRTLEVDPRAAVAANNLAWIYVDTDRNLDVAFELARTAKQQLPDEPNVNDTLGWIYFKKGLFDEALAALQHSVKMDPNLVDAHFHLGLTYVEKVDYEKARTHLRQALKLRPDFAGAAQAKKALAAIGG